MDGMNPITRKEMFLAAAGGQNVETPTPVTREEVFLDEIAKGGGGSSLPSTETASAGDVLSLDDNKEPQWAAPSGSGGGVLVVNITENDTGDAYVADKTYNEVLTAYQSGQLCLFSFYASACVVSKDEDYPELYGSTVSVSQNSGGGGTLYNYYIEYTTSGVTVSTEQYSLTAAN